MLLDSARCIIRDDGRMSGRLDGEVVDRWLTDGGDLLAGIPWRRYGLVAVEPRGKDALLESLEQMGVCIAENHAQGLRNPGLDRRLDLAQSAAFNRPHREVC